MNKFLTISTSTTLLLGAFLITGCGGSSGGDDGITSSVTFSGNTSPAAIDATNAEAIGTAAGESVEHAAASTELPLGVAIDNTVDMDNINNIVLTAASPANLPAGIDMSAEFCTSGSVDATDPGDVTSGPVDITVTFTNCALITAPLTLTGVVTVHFDDISDPNADFSFNYINFKVTDANGQTTTINLTINCTDSFNCTYSFDFVGTDGVIHRITGSSTIYIFGNAVDGYYGSATFYHGTFGKVSIDITKITFGGCGAKPDGGTIDYQSSDGSFGSITFNPDCTTSGTWTDSAGNSGSWPTPAA